MYNNSFFDTVGGQEFVATTRHNMRELNARMKELEETNRALLVELQKTNAILEALVEKKGE